MARLRKKIAVVLLVGLPSALPAKPNADQSSPASSFAREITSIAVKNSGASKSPGQLVSLAVPIQTGDVPAGNRIQIRENDGATVLTTQEDGCSLWRQDNSKKVCAVSFYEPRSLVLDQKVVYRIFSVAGAPDRTPKITTTDITGKTDLTVKTSNLTETQGKPETGTWDLISLNYVLTKCVRYSRPSGYGANPRCGWDVVASGPVRYGIHAFQYARREGDGSFHKWIRTDIWVDFWGSGGTPCPCSIALQIAQPNTWGPIAGGAVGSSPEGGYMFAAQVRNGSKAIYNLGGLGDSRVSTVTFDHLTGRIIFPGGRRSWVENAGGVFGISLSGEKLPAGLTAGTTYFFYTSGSYPDLISDKFQIYPYQCAAVQSCSTKVAPVTFSDDGAGAITATPLVVTTPFSGFLGLDEAAQRFWINAAGSRMPAPSLLVSHDFGYLTQKSKAVPPYITTLFGRLSALSGPPLTYFPNSYYFPIDMNMTGDGPGDERIGYLNRTGAYSLFMPYDPVAAQNSLVIGASFSLQHMYHEDEAVGFPDVFNNGANKNGASYPTLGRPQPTQHTYPYSGGTWLTPSTKFADLGVISERYGVWLESSHLPAPQQAPYLKTGQPEWQAQLAMEANAVVGNMQVTSAGVGKNIYYRVFAPSLKGFANMQTRGVAWGRRTVDMADFFEPAGSPIARYLHDLVADDVAYSDDFSMNGATEAQKSLGYYWNDVQSDDPAYQWWQDDFVFFSYGMNAWRGEYPRAGSFLRNYLYKQVITRLDALSNVGGGGCFWTGPARVVAPTGGRNSRQPLPTTWNGFYANTTAAQIEADWGAPPWRGCADRIGGFIVDGAGTNPAVPNGLTSIMAASTAIGAVIGIPHSDTLYKAIRTLQYRGPCTNCQIPLSFVSYRSSGANISEPTFAIGPLGAVN